MHGHEMANLDSIPAASTIFVFTLSFHWKAGISVGAVSETKLHAWSKGAKCVIFRIPCIAFLILTVIFKNENDTLWKPTPSN